jgi:hypothetical protein
VYVRCGKDREALATFKRATDWRMVLTLASKLNLPKEELQEISLELADTLKNLARFDEAALVFFDYCNAPETAINCLVSGSYWFEALQAVSLSILRLLHLLLFLFPLSSCRYSNMASNR